jgi:hypothetical protein
VEIGSADGGPGNADEHIHGADVGNRNIEEFESLFGPVFDQCAHVCAPWAMLCQVRLQSPSLKISVSSILNPDEP